MLKPQQKDNEMKRFQKPKQNSLFIEMGKFKDHRLNEAAGLQIGPFAQPVKGLRAMLVLLR